MFDLQHEPSALVFLGFSKDDHLSEPEQPDRTWVDWVDEWLTGVGCLFMGKEGLMIHLSGLCGGSRTNGGSGVVES